LGEMRILFVNFALPYFYGNKEYPIGGGASELDAWLHGLDAIGERGGVLVEKGGAALAREDAPCDLIETYDSSAGIRIAKYFYSYIPALLRAARAYRPDVLLQSSSGVQTGLMAFVANRLHVPFAYRVASDADADKRAANRLRRYEYWAFQYGLGQASVVLCQNEWQRTAFQGRIARQRLPVIHNPFVVAGTGAARLPRDRRKYVAWLGVFKSMKNLALLSEIAGRFADIQFRVAGMLPVSGADQRTVDALATLKSLPNVCLVGYVKRKDVLDFLSGAIALLITSDFEGFSNTYLEAFSVGTPVVTRNQVDPDHIVTNHRLGLATDLADDLGICVKQVCMMDTGAYDALSQHCIDYLRAHHSAPTKAKELIAVLRPVVDNFRVAG
jgi:glycosyltransferase involved in cell wall biosynthesis